MGRAPALIDKFLLIELPYRMTTRFFRKVGFGVKAGDKPVPDPLGWAQSQMDVVPALSWQGAVPTGSDLLTKYAHFIYQDRKILRKKHKKDRRAYQAAKDQVRYEVGERFHENLELAIRHDACLNSGAPVFERFWLFWCNHFAITDKDFMPQFTTGPFHRETIRPAMTGSFHALLQAATLSWSMIRNLDNSESVGPNSKSGKWRRKNGKPASVNENHARELLELHTVSPAADYQQADVVALSYIMAGWEHRYSKKRLECNEVHFEQDRHEPGTHVVLGKSYKQRGISPRNKLLDLLADLAAHPATIDFISLKLCRHFICDEPTEAMVAPVREAWHQSKGHLPTIHKAVLQEAFTHAPRHTKFQNPEIWLLQMVNMTGAHWPPRADQMVYEFKSEPLHTHKMPSRYMKEIGHSPYRPAQPNGFPDKKADWLSPELLIRRHTFANSFSRGIHRPDTLDIKALIENNFDNADEIYRLVTSKTGHKYADIRMQILFPSLWMLEA